MTIPDFPTLDVEVAFGDGPLNGSPTWVDVGGVREYSCNRGRQHELNRVEAGTARLLIDNRERKYDPLNTSSPLAASVLPMTPIRVRATHNSVVYDRFRGFIRSWQQNYSLGNSDATVTLDCVDAFAVFTLHQLQSYGEAVLADAPVGYWKLNDDAGATTSPDFGSNGQALTYGGSPSRRAFTGLQAARDMVDFDGSNDSANNTAPNAALRVAGNLTIEAWIKIDSLASMFPIMWMSEPSGILNVYSFYVETTGALTFSWDSDFGPFTLAGPTLVTGTTYHVAVVKDLANGEVRFYRNGVHTNTFSPYSVGDLTAEDTTATQDLYVGNEPNSPTFANGGICHVAIYNTALTTEQIKAHYARSYDVMVEQTTGAAIDELLDIIGWPPAERDLDTGSTTLQEFTPTGTLLEQMQAIAETENGILFMSRDGKVTFHERSSLLSGHLTVDGTFSDDGSDVAYLELVPVMDDTDIYNTITIERSGGIPQVATDDISESDYGPRTLSRSNQMMLTDLEALDAANYLLMRYKSAITRIPTLSLINGTGTPLTRWEQALARDIHHDRINVERTPPGGGPAIDVDQHIEGVQEAVNFQIGLWTTTFSMIPADQFQFWILGDSVYGVLGTTTRLGY